MDSIDILENILRKFHLGEYNEIRLNNELLMLLRSAQMAQIKECAKNARIKKYVRVGGRCDDVKFSTTFSDDAAFPTVFEIDQDSILKTKIVRSL